MDRAEQYALVVIMQAMDRLRAQGIPLAAEIGDRLPILYDALSDLGMIDDDGDDDASTPQVPVPDMFAETTSG